MISHAVHGTGKKEELLPKKREILKLTYMYSHHCVSPQSIEYYVDLIKKGKISIEKADQKLAKPCVYGIFNISRAIEKLELLINT